MDLTLLVVLNALLTLSNAFFPFGRDHGNYATAAWQWLDGSTPYRDVMVFKPPGTLFLHAIAQLAFGQTMWGIRVVDGIVHGLCAVVLYLLVVGWQRPRGWALFAGVAYTAAYFGFDDWHGAQTDTWLNAPVLIGMLALQRRSTRGTWAFAGGMVACAFWLKFTYLAAFLPLLVVGRGRTTLRDVAGRGLWMGSGFLAGLLAVLVWLFAAGGLDAFLQHTFYGLPAYAQLRSDPDSGFLHMLVKLRPLWVIAGTSAAAVVFAPWALRQARMHPSFAGLLPGLALLAVGVLSCVAQGKYFIYHYGSMLAPAALAAALVLSAIVRHEAVALGLCVAVLGAALGANPALSRERWTLLQSPDLQASYWDSRRFQRPDFNLQEQLAVGRWARANLDERQTLFIWGFDPLINFVSERHNPTKFIYNFPFRVRHDAQLEHQLLSQLVAAVPDAFVIGSNDATPWITGSTKDSAALLLEMTGLRRFVGQNYVPRLRIGRYTVFLRRPV